MGASWAICKRELRAYFTTPLAYVFIVIFVAMNGATAFFFGGFFDRGQADLQPLFSFLPWLYLFLIPAVAMRLWAEERKSGTLELMMTLPVSTTQAVIGKFLAAWIFTGIALALTFPIWITVNVLGDPGVRTGIKEYSDWPTIPQLYVDGEFVGGCDIVMDLHNSGELAKTLAQQAS